MRWLWLRLRGSLRLGLQETCQVQGSRMKTGLMVNAIALVVASFAMHAVGAIWTMAGYQGPATAP